MSARLRFLCFNIHGGRSLGGERDLKRINEIMNIFHVDIGVFQEMETRSVNSGNAEDVETLAGPERPYHLSGPSLTDHSGWYGNLIVSRFPILRGLVHNLETKADYEPRCAVDALIETPLGKIRVIGTHLSLATWERYSETRNLLKLVKEVEETEKNPLFLMGDLNEWRKKSKLLQHLNQLMIPVPATATFPSFFPLLKLDRAWHDAPHLKVTARVLSKNGVKKLSDHLPLLIEIH